MKLHEYLDNELDTDTIDILVINRERKIIEANIDYDSDVIEVVYRKIAIIKID